MQIRQRINAIREMPDALSWKREIAYSACVLLLGLVLGVVAKATDSVSIVGQIGTYLGVWVFVATMVAAFSKSPFLAALNTLLLFLAMLAAYYAYGQIVLGFFPRSYFLGWLSIALLSPVGGFVVWFSRGKGWPAIVSSALPVALLIAEGYPAYQTDLIYREPFVFDLCCAVALLIILPKTWKRKGLTLIISITLAVILASFHVLSFLPW
jgi:hypothetical protein